ncbi:hypothetical protein BJ508DRAFT_137027 [Ascobolus immersus RN42]|uniref:Uncharacterized protein n=1 Tax=Ascobolus immersus RN42 TaxID=1160509 RepID=A0A3N4I6R1_ASCIM|nr:hypothetical protein BJ508DRAFT_137027 [Ascobolus immersus RN42]
MQRPISRRSPKKQNGKHQPDVTMRSNHPSINDQRKSSTLCFLHLCFYNGVSTTSASIRQPRSTTVRCPKGAQYKAKHRPILANTSKYATREYVLRRNYTNFNPQTPPPHISKGQQCSPLISAIVVMHLLNDPINQSRHTLELPSQPLSSQWPQLDSSRHEAPS